MLPIKKEYTKDIVDEKWNTVAVLKYDQASMYEWYKFVESEYMNLELLKIINKWIEWKVKDQESKDAIIMSLVSQKFVDELYNTRYKTHESIYTSKGWKQAIQQSNIVYICKELWITPHELLHDYTMEEFGRYIDGLMYNVNEQSKEWKVINNRAMIWSDKNKDKKQENFKKIEDFLDNLDENGGTNGSNKQSIQSNAWSVKSKERK